MSTEAQRRRPLWPVAGMCALGLLVGCAGANDADGAPAPAPEVTTTSPAPVSDDEAPSEPTTAQTVAPAGLEGVDLGNLEWLFRPGGNVPETVQVPLVDGAATVDQVQYTMGEPVLSDANADGLLDAVVPLQAIDGNAVDEQWYLWIATDDAPIQVSLPVARSASCGTVTRSVTAVDGGFEVHELRRGLGDSAVPCAGEGSDERIRTVGAIEARNVDEWWPVQLAPVEGFGGLCPAEVTHDAYPNDAPLHAAPDPAAPTATGQPPVFELEPWPVYGEAFEGWRLVGVMQESELGCAWVQPTG